MRRPQFKISNLDSNCHIFLVLCVCFRSSIFLSSYIILRDTQMGCASSSPSTSPAPSNTIVETAYIPPKATIEAGEVAKTSKPQPSTKQPTKPSPITANDLIGGSLL